MHINFSRPPTRAQRRAGLSWGRRATQAAAAAALAAVATAGPVLIQQPSHPSAASVHCGELCGLSTGSLPVSL
jgi:hypothetical protein